MLADDGLRHLSRLGTSSLCKRRTQVQGNFPARRLCDECASVVKALEPPARTQPKQHPDSAVKVTTGPESALPRRRTQDKPISPQLRALAKRLGRDPSELAENVSGGHSSSAQGPVLEHVTEEVGAPSGMT